MAKSNKPRFKLFSFLLDLLIDLALIGLGVVLYYQFMVKEIILVTLSPALTGLVGGQTNAVYLISGLPFTVGSLSLVRSLVRLPRQISGR